MKSSDALRSLLRAKGVLDPMRLERARRARLFNDRQFPRHTGRTINVPCEIVDQPNPKWT